MNPKNFLLTVVLVITTVSAQAWDDDGHMLIGQIAARQLRPEVVQKMEALLPLLDTKFSDGRAYNLVTAGTWMDDMRGLGKDYKWSRWHYIDVPCNGDRSYTEPPPPHALWALDQAVDVLRSKNAEPKARAEALGQIMHLIGDIHQPLHVADRNDKGGNGVHITPLPADSGHGPENLHAFWDASYRYDAADGKITELWPRLHSRARPAVNEPGVISEHACLLLKNAPQPAAVPISKKPWNGWAYETHALACQSGWPQEVPDATTGKVQLTPAFVHQAHEIASQQLVKAGTRLAALLNELFGEDTPKKENQP